MTTFKVLSSEVMVHAQFSGKCWHSSLYHSNVVEDSHFFVAFNVHLNLTLIYRIEEELVLATITVLVFNFQRFDCEYFFPIQKLLGGR